MFDSTSVETQFYRAVFRDVPCRTCGAEHIAIAKIPYPLREAARPNLVFQGSSVAEALVQNMYMPPKKDIDA